MAVGGGKGVRGNIAFINVFAPVQGVSFTRINLYFYLREWNSGQRRRYGNIDRQKKVDGSREQFFYCSIGTEMGNMNVQPGVVVTEMLCGGQQV